MQLGVYGEGLVRSRLVNRVVRDHDVERLRRVARREGQRARRRHVIPIAILVLGRAVGGGVVDGQVALPRVSPGQGRRDRHLAVGFVDRRRRGRQRQSRGSVVVLYFVLELDRISQRRVAPDILVQGPDGAERFGPLVEHVVQLGGGSENLRERDRWPDIRRVAGRNFHDPEPFGNEAEILAFDGRAVLGAPE